MQGDSETDVDSIKFIYPVVKPEDLQDLKQEPVDEYSCEGPCFTTKVIYVTCVCTTCIFVSKYEKIKKFLE